MIGSRPSPKKLWQSCGRTGQPVTTRPIETTADPSAAAERWALSFGKAVQRTTSARCARRNLPALASTSQWRDVNALAVRWFFKTWSTAVFHDCSKSFCQLSSELRTVFSKVSFALQSTGLVSGVRDWSKTGHAIIVCRASVLRAHTWRVRVSKRVKFTSKVKRGMVLARGLVLDSLNPDCAPGFTTVRKWKRSDERDLNAALAYMEQVEDDLAAKAQGAEAVAA